MIKAMWLVTNYSCNNRCKWCYTESKGFPKEIMPLNYAKDVLDEMKKAGVERCTLIGGEPTMYPHIFELIEYGDSLGIFMKIVTNAVLLSDDEYVKKLKRAGLSLAAISIHGITPETYIANTQRDHFEKVLTAMENCKKNELAFVTLTTINRLNAQNIYDTAVFLTKVGVKNIIYNIAVPNSADEEVEELVLNPKEIAQVIEENYIKLKGNGLKAGFYASIPLCLFNRELLSKMLEEEYLIPLPTGGCNIYYSSGFSFEPNGNIIPCCKKLNEALINTKIEDDKFKYKGDFDSLWNEIKNNFGSEAWKYPSEKCETCSLKASCIGGCKMFWEYFNSDDYVIGG